MVNAPFFKFPSTPHISFSSENVLRSDKLIDAEEKEILNKVKENCKKYEIKSNTVYSNNKQELILEVILEKNESILVEKLKECKAINMASLVKYNGEYIAE